ncbi:MAG: hypothetical protein FJW54_05790 [Actinobacteria bacterium]|nr:hypothetical protein [Actinomycetota bacterium]
MSPLKAISDRKIIYIALICWAVTAVGSLITNRYDLAISSLIAILLGLYGLRIMRKKIRR